VSHLIPPPQVSEPYREGHRQAEDRVRTQVPGDYRDAGPFGMRYTFVTVEAEGRSENEAAVKAQEALALQRGIWNLALLRSRPLVSNLRPLNHVLRGPVHSLHRPDGELLLWPMVVRPGLHRARRTAAVAEARVILRGCAGVRENFP
jgi:hypothetical protein